MAGIGVMYDTYKSPRARAFGRMVRYCGKKNMGTAAPRKPCKTVEIHAFSLVGADGKINMPPRETTVSGKSWKTMGNHAFPRMAIADRK